MIVEWFVKFITGVVSLLLAWLPTGSTLALPNFAPAFGVMRSLDAATAGVVGETFTVIALLLTVNVMLFSFGLIRQLWRFVPIIGGG